MLRLYIIRFAFFLTILQSALVVYLSVIGINDGEFYSKLFNYSLILSIVPIVFAILTFSFSSEPSNYVNQSNGFVNQNITKTSIEKHKSVQINETSMYLLALDFVFVVYNFFFNILSLPFWVVFVFPLFLSILILKDNKRNLN